MSISQFRTSYSILLNRINVNSNTIRNPRLPQIPNKNRPIQPPMRPILNLKARIRLRIPTFLLNLSLTLSSLPIPTLTLTLNFLIQKLPYPPLIRHTNKNPIISFDSIFRK